ncbi:MAG: hypothetical protein QM487_04140 [Candidatus Marithrix sp.]
MASTIIFVILAIVTILTLIGGSVATAVASSNIFDSTEFNNNKTARDAHSNLTISSAVGFSGVAVILLITIIAAFSGGFSVKEFSDEFFANINPSVLDLENAEEGERVLKAGQTGRTITMIVWIIITILIIAVAILASIGTGQIGGLVNQDDKSRSAYGSGIAGSVLLWISVISSIGALVFYFILRNYRTSQLKEVSVYNSNYTETTQIVHT